MINFPNLLTDKKEKQIPTFFQGAPLFYLQGIHNGLLFANYIMASWAFSLSLLQFGSLLGPLLFYICIYLIFFFFPSWFNNLLKTSFMFAFLFRKIVKNCFQKEDQTTHLFSLENCFYVFRNRKHFLSYETKQSPEFPWSFR